MNTAFVYDPTYLLHETGFSHPEQPFRLQSILSKLTGSGLIDKLLRIEPTYCDLGAIIDTHTREHVDYIRTLSENGPSHVDMDTPLSKASFMAAHLAAGGVLDACRAVAEKKVRNAFCSVRPPGHHATKKRAMGFCLFNNVAIAAKQLGKVHGFERILIVDWDVHHGNGTQDIFYEDPSVFLFSIHQQFIYPGSGSPQERGAGAGEGTTLNAPMPSGSRDADYLRVFREQLVPAAMEYSPDFMLISAGFDAHEEDPLAHINLSDHGFAAMTVIVKQLADELCEGRLVSVLEGGYNLDALSRSVERHVRVLANYELGIRN
jgi:acetoin utilization deacetylase AcuC-like enzyme